MNAALVMAHRGGYVYGRENALETVQKALVAGADIIELDVRKSRDGVLYCHHGSVPWGMAAATFFGVLTFTQIQKLVGKRDLLSNILETIPTTTSVYLDIKDSWITRQDVEKTLTGRANTTIMRSDILYGSLWLRPLLRSGKVELLKYRPFNPTG